MHLRTAIAAWVILFSTSAVWADLPSRTLQESKAVTPPFSPGEKLTYTISWSRLVQAGIAVMEVRGEQTKEGERTYHFISKTNSVGLLESIYPVRDSVESVVDAREMNSISYRMQESHGTKKRQRSLLFDRIHHTVRYSKDQDKPETHRVPKHIHDALSSLYYVRTLKDFVVGKPIIVEVHDSGKNWAVEVHVLGKERIKTPAGEFNTIKLKTHPKYEGVFMNKGEIFIWITDDAKKIPVLMQSTISIGSIVATLTHIEGGNN